MNEQQAFEEALKIQAVGAGTPTLTLDDVRGRAQQIRRRRATAGAAGAAVLVAAAVVPIAMLVGADRSTDSLPPAHATPTVVDSANPVTVDQRGSWVEGRAVHPAEGEPFTLDVSGEVVSVIGLDDGRWVLGVYPPDRSFEVVLTDATGGVLATHEATDGALASDDTGGAVVWMHPEGQPQLLVSGEDRPVDFSADLTGGRAPSELREILPGCSVEECVVLVEFYDSSPDGSTYLAVSLAGERLPLDRLGLLSITDVSPDGALVSGVVSADELSMEYCSAVVVFATGAELWRTCEAGSFRFSPDGTRVLGVDPYLDGFGHSFVVTLDARNGAEVGRYGGGTLFDETWVSEEELLVSQQLADGTNQLLRVAADGSIQTVFAQQDGPPLEPSPLRLTGP